jgi:hypothetical protein
MSFFGKKNEKHDTNLSEIKKVVEEFKPVIQPTIQKSPIDRLLEEVPAKSIVESESKIEVKERYVPLIKADIPPIRESERPSFAPLFIKIDRYRQILNSIGNLKTAMIMIKNSLVTVIELDKARDETFKLIQDAMEKMEKRLSMLDQELIRPSGYHEFAENLEYHDVETIGATVADLRGQIEQLKSELENVS